MYQGSKSKREFNIDKNIKIYLYGMNEQAKIHAKELRSRGYCIAGFIDKRMFDKETHDNINIYTLDKICIKNPEDSCVIIMLQNAVNHDIIAKKITRIGIINILYLPMQEAITDEKASVLRNKYNEFLSERYEKLKGIPCYYIEDTFEMAFNRCVIDDSNSRIRLMVPAELLFSSLKSSDEKFAKYNNLPLPMVQPYNELFDFLSGAKFDCNEYMEKVGLCAQIYDKTVNIDNVISHRISLYVKFTNEINRGMQFFYDSSAKVSWNSRGYFNIIDGHHRVFFLFHRKIYLIPISVTRNDFDKIMNIGKAKELYIFLKKKNIYKLPAPIEHPLFVGFPTEREFGENKIIIGIEKLIQKNVYKDKKILDISNYTSYFARNMARLEVRSVVAYEQNEQNYQIARLANEILSISNISLELKNWWGEEQLEEADIVFLLDAWKNIGDNDLNLAYKNLDYITKDILIWQSGAEIENDKEMIKNAITFKDYYKIGYFFNGQCVTEVGVFSKQTNLLAEFI